MRKTNRTRNRMSGMDICKGMGKATLIAIVFLASVSRDGGGEAKRGGSSLAGCNGDQVEYFPDCDGNGGTKVITHKDGSQEFINY